ncbi:hypothetical protein [Nocardia grenadensis]|uniref:hypothetical protein n=1 Tax=Nocardia grenadensis TaxID=931537 RepID=UPI003D7401ED
MRSAYPAIDILTLGARYYRPSRALTADGFEASFALFYLSRYLLTHGLAETLGRSTAPIVLDLSGPGGDLARINWDDLQFARGYDPDAVMHQCGKLSDLLAVIFVREHANSGVRYLLLHPGGPRPDSPGPIPPRMRRQWPICADAGNPPEPLSLASCTTSTTRR